MRVISLSISIFSFVVYKVIELSIPFSTVTVLTAVAVLPLLSVYEYVRLYLPISVCLTLSGGTITASTISPLSVTV
jgi:hypothetical protein